MSRRKSIVSPCHQATIDFSRADGVNIGSCSQCHDRVVRTNPTTGHEEWLDGKSPWTKEKLRPVKR